MSWVCNTVVSSAPASTALFLLVVELEAFIDVTVSELGTMGHLAIAAESLGFIMESRLLFFMLMLFILNGIQ